MPVLEIVRVWPEGVAPPEIPLKVKAVGLREMWGLGIGLTVKLVPFKAQLVAPLGV